MLCNHLASLNLYRAQALKLIDLDPKLIWTWHKISPSQLLARNCRLIEISLHHQVRLQEMGRMGLNQTRKRAHTTMGIKVLWALKEINLCWIKVRVAGPTCKIIPKSKKLRKILDRRNKKISFWHFKNKTWCSRIQLLSFSHLQQAPEPPNKMLIHAQLNRKRTLTNMLPLSKILIN